MSSGFSGGGAPDFFIAGRRSSTTNFKAQQQFSFRSPLSGTLRDPNAQIRRPDFSGKRSLSEIQEQNQERLGFYFRNVKQRPNYQHASPISTLSPVDFSPAPFISPEVSSVPILQQHRLQPLTLSNSIFSPNLSMNKGNGDMGPGTGRDIMGLGSESEKKMMNHRLQELEKELLGDEEDGEGVSAVTNSEWSDTIRNLINPTRNQISPSPTTSSSSSCCSTSASSPIPCTKQSFMDVAAAISDTKQNVAAKIFTRLQQVANPRGTSEQRLTVYMVLALKSRVYPTEHPPPASELYGKEHVSSTQMLYDVSPCFKLGFMAANLAILDATSEQGFQKIHVLDFEIGHGGQYMHLLHALAARKCENKRAVTITTFTDFATGGDEKLKIVGQELKALANKLGVCFNFSIKNSNITELSREKLGIEPDEALAVNFAFKLYKLPDESVTTENLRDDLLRRVKSLSPAVMTVVEQEINANTAPLTVRVREVSEHYGALFDSLEATVPAHNPDRVRIEEALGRKLGNTVACEGRDRVERCELFGKWRARMSMAGFRPVPMGQPISESLRVKLNSVTRGNSGFTVIEQSGGICFGWMGRTLTVACAWR
ncbi:hypothetical protein CDL12_07028 [Handroanthus impetiginosus]|uniref:Uncharacterized protein n=1 Tax=Handroanthus impetiginosus TaxID=429701 RepID=A0A2G9HS00_9LAMI|nr:hypothetical protein CDL12_07028 [Handroanthus impetiginosus]